MVRKVLTVCGDRDINKYSNMTFFFRFVDKRAIYRWYNLIRTCAGESASMNFFDSDMSKATNTVVYFD
jgi:hypothetical protein